MKTIYNPKRKQENTSKYYQQYHVEMSSTKKNRHDIYGNQSWAHKHVVAQVFHSTDIRRICKIDATSYNTVIKALHAGAIRNALARVQTKIRTKRTGTTNLGRNDKTVKMYQNNVGKS